MKDAGFIIGSYVVTFAAIGLYALANLRRGRRLAQQVPPEEAGPPGSAGPGVHDRHADLAQRAAPRGHHQQDPAPALGGRAAGAQRRDHGPPRAHKPPSLQHG
jgi:hypothetical protein